MELIRIIVKFKIFLQINCIPNLSLFLHFICARGNNSFLNFSLSAIDFLIPTIDFKICLIFKYVLVLVF